VTRAEERTESTGAGTSLEIRLRYCCCSCLSFARACRSSSQPPLSRFISAVESSPPSRPKALTSLLMDLIASTHTQREEDEGDSEQLSRDCHLEMEATRLW